VPRPVFLHDHTKVDGAPSLACNCPGLADQDFGHTGPDRTDTQQGDIYGLLLHRTLLAPGLNYLLDSHFFL
jgi:hypothetical protein